MTEHEAASEGCQSPLDFVATIPSYRQDGRYDARKWWLAAVVCGRHNRNKMSTKEYRRLLVTLERYSDGAASDRQVQLAMTAAGYSRNPLERSSLGHDPIGFAFGEAADLGNTPIHHLLCRALRCIIGTPYRLVTLAHTTSTVISLARAAHEERIRPSFELDPQRLGVLADALEEIGAAEEIVAHLRGPGPHVRGCWAVDLCLGKQ